MSARTLSPVLAGLLLLCGVAQLPEAVIDSAQAESGPLNATYTIDGSTFQLRNGTFSRPAAPDSAARETITVFDAPVFGLLDGDQETDAAVILVYEGGGSGRFYYLAAAINGPGGYRGTNALFLGDRVIPQAAQIRNRAIVTAIKDRRPSEPFASAPTVDVTRYAIVSDNRLVAVPPIQQQSGWVTYGHEVRSFAACNRSSESWLLGQSPALPQIRASYEKIMSQAQPYAPVFVVMAGSFMDPPAEGFGADYASAFFATELTRIKPGGNCREEFISIQTPEPGTVVNSPLIIKGRARGSWFFEGDFPVVLEDAAGNVLARSFVTAEEEWMTQEFVTFTGEISFTNTVEGLAGKLIFKKDNPTDRRDLDDSSAIPVIVGVAPP